MHDIIANVVADTTYRGRRLLTLVCDYPRFIHPQVMTYGMIRKSTSSSRAIPVKRQLELSQDDPFIPRKLSRNQPGMGAEHVLDDASYADAAGLIREHYEAARVLAQKLDALGVHKQHANRYLEPWLMARCTMTGAVQAFEHLISQRAGPGSEVDVQPEMHELACRIRDAIKESVTRHRQWHVPYCQHPVPQFDDVCYAIARAARDSYRRDDVKPEFMDRLRSLQDEGHLGPFEHVAYYDDEADHVLAVGPYNLPCALTAPNADTAKHSLLMAGWRTVRHLGLDEARKLLGGFR